MPRAVGIGEYAPLRLRSGQLTRLLAQITKIGAGDNAFGRYRVRDGDLDRSNLTRNDGSRTVTESLLGDAIAVGHAARRWRANRRTMPGLFPPPTSTARNNQRNCDGGHYRSVQIIINFWLTIKKEINHADRRTKVVPSYALYLLHRHDHLGLHVTGRICPRLRPASTRGTTGVHRLWQNFNNVEVAARAKTVRLLGAQDA